MGNAQKSGYDYDKVGKIEDKELINPNKKELMNKYTTIKKYINEDTETNSTVKKIEDIIINNPFLSITKHQKTCDIFPLVYVCQKRPYHSRNIVKILLNNNFDPIVVDNKKKCAFLCSLTSCLEVSVIKLFVDKGANLIFVTKSMGVSFNSGK